MHTDRKMLSRDPAPANRRTEPCLESILKMGRALAKPLIRLSLLQMRNWPQSRQGRRSVFKPFSNLKMDVHDMYSRAKKCQPAEMIDRLSFHRFLSGGFGEVIMRGMPVLACGRSVCRIAICSVTPPIRAASLRVAPSYIAAKASNRRVCGPSLVHRAAKRS